MTLLRLKADEHTGYAIWQRQYLQEEVLDRQLSYWPNQLSNAPETLDLATDYPRPAVKSYRGVTHTFVLSKE
jgi:hypothetical protein